MGLKEEMELSIITLEMVGYHYRTTCEAIADVLINLYGLRNLRPYFGLESNAPKEAVMNRLKDYLYNNEWRSTTKL